MPFIELVAQRRSPSPPPGMTPPENAKDWFSISNSADVDTTDVYIYNDIGGWFGIYSDEFIDEFKQIATKNVNLRLNSPGGSVFEGIAIANAIRSHPANVTVYVDGLAASIASVIMLAGDRVVMLPQSQVMIHNASGGCYGDATEMTKMADLLDKQSKNIAEAYAERTGRPVDEFLTYMADETWFSAKEAVEIGLADEAMPMRPNKGEEADDPAAAAVAKLRQPWDLTAFRYAGRDAAPAPAEILNRGRVPVVRNVMRQFDEGDRVAAIVKHEPEHTTGTIAVVNGNAYGVIWDVPDDDTMENDTDVYRWYVDDELQWLGGGADHDPDEAAETEPTLETTEAGSSHPYGYPIPPHASAADEIAAKFVEAFRDMARTLIQAELAVIEGTAIGSHSTAVKSGAWDAGANEGHLPSPVPVATVRKMYTYYDETKVEDGKVPKSACKLPHHFVSADGTPGAASINGVRNALARLPQTQGLSDAERKTAEAHLRAHLNAFSGGGEEEDHVHDEIEEHVEAHVHDEIDDAAKKKQTPPKKNSPPDQEEEGPEEDEDPDAEPDEDEDEPDDKATTPVDEWAGVVSSLTTRSPSADDVFNSLKEAW